LDKKQFILGKNKIYTRHQHPNTLSKEMMGPWYHICGSHRV